MNYTLKSVRPTPTEAEQAVCELFAKGKWAGDEAERLKPEVEAIVSKYGEVVCETGILAAAESTPYPVPTVAEYAERIAELRRRLEAERAATEPDAQTIARLEQAVASGGRWAEELKSFHEFQDWMKEMKDFFKVCQPAVILAKKTPTVRCYRNKRPAPPRRKLGEEAAAVPQP